MFIIRFGDKSNHSAWLTVCFSSTMGRTALSSLEIPWPVILCDQDVSSENLALIHHMPDGVGKDSLLDSLMGITAKEQGVNPSCGNNSSFCRMVIQRISSMDDIRNKMGFGYSHRITPTLSTTMSS